MVMTPPHISSPHMCRFSVVKWCLLSVGAPCDIASMDGFVLRVPYPAACACAGKCMPLQPAVLHRAARGLSCFSIKQGSPAFCYVGVHCWCLELAHTPIAYRVGVRACATLNLWQLPQSWPACMAGKLPMLAHRWHCAGSTEQCNGGCLVLMSLTCMCDLRWHTCLMCCGLVVLWRCAMAASHGQRRCGGQPPSQYLPKHVLQMTVLQRVC